MTLPQPSEPEEVRVGMLLAAEDPPRGLRTEPHYDLWAVKSVRKLKNGDASVTLIQAIDCGSAEATAKFPGGVVADPFRHWLPSRNDAKHIFGKLASS